MALDAKRQRFVELFVTCLNAAEAARGAGYSPKTARQQGARLLTNADVAQAIADAQAKLSKSTSITLERWLEEWAALAFSSVEHYQVDPGGGMAPAASAPPNVMRAISSVKAKTFMDPEGGLHTETEYRLWSKPDALKNIGQHLGFYPSSFGGEGSPNGRQATLTIGDKAKGEKTIIDWGPGLRIEW